MGQSSNALSNPLMFQTPDCIRCLRRKLNALGVAAFYNQEDTWFVGDFESDKPSSDAEFQFNYLLKIKAPEIIANTPKGIILNSDEEVRSALPGINFLLDGCALIGARTEYPGLGGVRLAWRSNQEPFTEQDLQTLQCFGKCPADCGL